MSDIDDEHLFMPDDYPHSDLYWSVVPIWCERTDDIEWKTYACGVGFGFEFGIIMAMLRPEWAQGFYHKLLAYYQKTYQEEDHVGHWDGHSAETAEALPVSGVSTITDPRPFAEEQEWSLRGGPIRAPVTDEEIERR